VRLYGVPQPTIVPPLNTKQPLILALDLGTSSARAALYSSDAELLEGSYSQIPYEMTRTTDGGVEVDPDHLIELLCRVIDDMLAKSRTLVPNMEAICGVGSCTFWHSLLGVDDRGRAVTPLFNWSDTRSRSDVEALEARLGSDWLHVRTGCMPHSSYYPAKILWLRRARPELAARVSRWVSIGEYFYARIFGRYAVSASMASGTGLFNPNKGDWANEVLAAIGVSREMLSSIAPSGERFQGLVTEFEARWPELAGLPWSLAIGDGAASNIGSGCVTPDAVAINVGTSGAMRVCWKANKVEIPRGLWCYCADSNHFVMGGALSNGGDVYAWCREVFRFEDDGAVDGLEDTLPDSHGLTVLPFFSGERSTGWADHARAAINGMTLHTTPRDIVVAMLEAVSYRFAAIFDLLKPELSTGTRIIASGGAILRSEYWTQMMADVIGVPVIGSRAREASSRGAAIFALATLGQISDFSEIPGPLGKTFEPRSDRYAVYQRARLRQERLYEKLVTGGDGVLVQ
jgi:gluconokinase